MTPPRHWLSRLVIVSWAGNLALVTLTTPESLGGRALAQIGPSGYAATALLAVLSAAGLVDGLVNDLMPPRYRVWLKHYRHLGFMSLAITLSLLAAATVIKIGVTPMLASYLMPSLFAVTVTWLDIFDRHRERCP